MPLKLSSRSVRSVRAFHSASRLGCAKSATSSPVKLRFAPSPTGFLHLGGLRTALYNHLLARKLGGEWILRVEDTDQTRFVPGAVESLLRTLKWAGLDYDRGPGKETSVDRMGPYFQSQRAEIYNRYLEPLLASGKAYHCFCSPDRLAQTRKLLQKQGQKGSTYDRKCLGLNEAEVKERLSRGEQSIVRFKSSSKRLVQKDVIYDSIAYESLPIEDFVLRKSDGLPTYHFANVVDDYEMGVTHVLRGEEWLPSTPKHVQLYEALSLPLPKFAHLPLLVNPDGSKLSKRTGDVKVEDYIDKGYEASALLNFVALLGWSPQSQASSDAAATGQGPRPVGPEEEEGEAEGNGPDHSRASDVLSMPQLIAKFSLEGINKNRPTLQQGKLDWLNRHHIKMKLFARDDARLERPGAADAARKDLAERTRAAVLRDVDVMGSGGENPGPRETLLEPEYVLAVVDALKDRIHTINDVAPLGRYFFVSPDYDSPAARKMYRSLEPAVYRDTLSAAIPIVSSLPDRFFSRSLSTSQTPRLEQELLVALSSISIVTPSPSPTTTTTTPADHDDSNKKMDSRQKASQVMSPLRHALTGQKVGASVAATVRVLGRDRVRKTFERAIEWSLRRERSRPEGADAT